MRRTKRTVHLLTALLLALVPGLSCRSVPRTELLNRESLDGWSFYLVEPDVTMDDVWSLEDGILVCKGEPLGYIHTTQDYTNFRLLVEWRWAPGTEPGNSGVLMRVNGEAKGVPRCIEAQLKHGEAGDLYGFHGMKINGDPARLRTVANHEVVGDLVGVKRMADLEKAPGEWNTYEIVADGPKITVFVNGTQANEAWDSDVLAGPIALQSEGGEIHFRRVSLTPID